MGTLREKCGWQVGRRKEGTVEEREGGRKALKGIPKLRELH